MVKSLKVKTFLVITKHIIKDMYKIVHMKGDMVRNKTCFVLKIKSGWRVIQRNMESSISFNQEIITCCMEDQDGMKLDNQVNCIWIMSISKSSLINQDLDRIRIMKIQLTLDLNNSINNYSLLKFSSQS